MKRCLLQLASIDLLFVWPLIAPVKCDASKSYMFVNFTPVHSCFCPLIWLNVFL
uniref:Uncharacterized protein n=1 Tax=Arundo donax TaxID=35708 RepID=A0A0A9A5S8_ARUDO